MTKRQVCIVENQVHLTPIEYKLLTTLIKYACKVVTHGQLLKEVWGPAYAEKPVSARVHDPTAAQIGSGPRRARGILRPKLGWVYGSRSGD